MPDGIRQGDTVAHESGSDPVKTVEIGRVTEVTSGPKGQVTVKLEGDGLGVWNKDQTVVVPNRE